MTESEVIQTDDPEDIELLTAFQQEETRNLAFNRLIRKYQQRIYRHIRRMVIDHDDADDLTQNCFIKVWQNLQTFQHKAKLSTWIYTIATNECISFLRKKRMRFFIPIHDIEQELANKLDSGSLFSGNEIERKLQKAILTLPEKQRLVFNLKYFEELTYEEIQEVLGTSVGALKASYHHAVKKIETYLQKEEL
ncbi:MAG: RNA polymerase sigma factor [Bacteroidia bacterium]|nr:RNA polymerase sigma factor [Bacteroidia bacterium]